MSSCVEIKDKNALMLKFLIGLSIAVLALSIAVAVITNEFIKVRTRLENDYSRALYEAGDSLDDLEVNLSKFIASADKQRRVSLASDIFRQSQTAASALSALPIESQTVTAATRFVNQLGDYCYFAGKKISKGDSLSKEENEALINMHAKCKSVSEEVKAMVGSLGAKYRILAHSDSTAPLAPSESFSSRFSKASKESAEYPVLIYDGPFSDAAEQRDYKHLKGLENVSVDTAKSVVRAALTNQKVKGITYLGEAADAENENVKTLEFSAETASASKYFQVSKRGGKVINISGYRSVDGVIISEEEAKERAVRYAQLLGYGTLKPVWIEVSEKSAFVNLAPEQDGVILYPDLVKVKVAMDNGEILGVEATNYLLNHVERECLAAELTKKQAQQYLNPALSITSSRLALIPTETSSETLCYEFHATTESLAYLIYIDATSGAERNLLRLLPTNQGTLLM